MGRVLTIGTLGVAQCTESFFVNVGDEELPLNGTSSQPQGSFWLVAVPAPDKIHPSRAGQTRLCHCRDSYRTEVAVIPG